MIVERPEPLLKAKHLLIKAAPFSPNPSDPEPAFGKVIVTVEVEAASSVTTVNPLESLVTDADEAFAVSGVVLGRLNSVADDNREKHKKGESGEHI
jgi:hypothetical protein